MDAFMKKIEEYVRSIPDFPEEGIIFRDITTVLQDADGFSLAIEEMDKLLDGVDYDALVGIDSRGFIFGAALAYKNNKAFIPARKPGKLPCETITEEYELEYGSAKLQMHTDSIKPGQKVVIVDDLVATAGTVKAAINLVEKLGGEVAKVIFLIELQGLNGREKLAGYDMDAVIKYEGK